VETEPRRACAEASRELPAPLEEGWRGSSKTTKTSWGLRGLENRDPLYFEKVVIDHPYDRREENTSLLITLIIHTVQYSSVDQG
jgi:hypothetical protein